MVEYSCKHVTATRICVVVLLLVNFVADLPTSVSAWNCEPTSLALCLNYIVGASPPWPHYNGACCQALQNADKYCMCNKLGQTNTATISPQLNPLKLGRKCRRNDLHGFRCGMWAWNRIEFFFKFTILYANMINYQQKLIRSGTNLQLIASMHQLVFCMLYYWFLCVNSSCLLVSSFDFLWILQGSNFHGGNCRV